jgi:hypothetical protein
VGFGGLGVGWEGVLVLGDHVISEIPRQVDKVTDQNKHDSANRIRLLSALIPRMIRVLTACGYRMNMMIYP